MIVILTALPEEYSAVRTLVTQLSTHPTGAGTVFEKGVLAAREVALAIMGPGNTTAAVITDRAITEFEPSAVLFVGKAGGLRPWTRLGDVVVATRVYGYHGGLSSEEAFLSRPRAWDADHRLSQYAHLVQAKDTWHQRHPGDPSVHFGPMAAGEVVLDAAASATAKHLYENYNDAIAIEMESAGVALASHINNRTASLTIRGIGDHADGTKPDTDTTNAARRAIDNAAAFAAAVIAEYEDPSPRRSPTTSTPAATHTNVVSGHARVVNQIGVVQGDFNYGPPRDGDS